MMHDHTTLQDFALRSETASIVSGRLILRLEKTRLELRRSREVGSIGGGGIAAYVDGIVGWFDNLLSLGVVERQLVEAEWKLHGLRLVWVESDATEALEIAYRLLSACTPDINIALDDFGGAALARIGHRSGCDNGLALLIAHEGG